MECYRNQLNNISSILLDINSQSQENKCVLESISHQLCSVQDSIYLVYQATASVNPIAVAAEYPTVEDDKVVYSTTKVRFLDLLNPNLVVLFKGTFEDHLPVYFKDIINYEHIVTIGDINTTAYADDLVNNYNYPALYVGNYIILNPTEQTLEDFKNGTL